MRRFNHFGIACSATYGQKVAICPKAFFFFKGHRVVSTGRACHGQNLHGTPWAQNQGRRLQPCPHLLVPSCKQLCHPRACHHRAWGGSARWASITTRQGALEGGGDNLRGQMKVVPQVLNALVCKVPVIVTPGKLLLHIPTGLEASQSLDHLQVGDRFELRVLGGVEILLGHHHSLLEEVLVDGHTVLLGPC